MGLAVCIGNLAECIKDDEEWADDVREELQRVNALLEANGIEPFDEPEELPELQSRCPINGYPYSFLHYLRRVAAIRANEPDFVAQPLEKGMEPDSPWIEVEAQKNLNHLICHSDAEGYYVPRAFKPVLIDESGEIPGAYVGSSYTLHDELVAVAPALKISLSGKELSDSEAQRISELIESESALWIEHLVWLDLFEASRLSIQHGTAIVFS
jgi:hypothetical protein